MSWRRRRWLVTLSLALVSIAAVVGGTAAGAATAPTAVPDAAAIERVAAQTEPPDGGGTTPSAPGSPPRLQSTLGVVVGVADQGFAIATKEGRARVVVRPVTRILIDRHPGSLDEIKTGDVVLVIGRKGPRGNYVARAVRVVSSANGE